MYVYVFNLELFYFELIIETTTQPICICQFTSGDISAHFCKPWIEI